MAEDFNRMKLMAKKLVKTPFRQKWQFRVDFDQAPQDFEIFVKDITYGPTEVTSEEVKIGAITLTLAEGLGKVNISLTMRDHQDKRIAKWFDDWAAKAVNPDGTVNLPYGNGGGYVRKLTLYSINEDGSEEKDEEWEVVPGQRGDVTLSYDDPAHLEFPCTFIQFCSTGLSLGSSGGSSGISIPSL